MTSDLTSMRQIAETVLTGNYGERDLCLVRGKGVFVWDAEGRRYLDLLSGLGVNNLGHCHPRVVDAIQRQAEQLLHVSNLYLNEPQIELAQLLVEHSSADRVFFCNSGAEAIEAAIKMARRHAHNHQGAGERSIVCLSNSFHGRTMGALSATGQSKYHEGFAPLTPGFKHISINDVDALRAAMDSNVCAVILEPVQGEGGVHLCSGEFVREARRLCDECGALLIFDEVQCGLGRAGHLFASEEYGVESDLITLAKSLAGGVPIGALLAKEKAAAAFTPGSHASTFGGNPLAAAAGLAAFQTVLDERLPERAKRIGEAFRANLRTLQEKYECIMEVRGAGLMIGVQLTFPSAGLIRALRDRGILAGPAGPNVLRFLPPLVIEESMLLDTINVLDELIPMMSQEG